MSSEEQNLYYTIVTDYGLKAIQEATLQGKKIEITHLAIGDGNGSSYELKADMNSLKNELYRTVVEEIKVDSENTAKISFQAIIPPSSGGYTIREAGLFDKEGKLFAIAKLADTIKPKIEQGAAKELKVKLILELSHSEAIDIAIDPSFVLASQKWINESFSPLNHLKDFNNPHKVTIAQALAAGGQKDYDYRFPKGGIIMWSGATNKIPTGWTLCNGQNGTPDLRNRFVIGAGSSYAVNAKGGAVDKTTTAAGNHYHSFSRTTSTNGSHHHVVTGYSDNHTLSTSQMPKHNHTVKGYASYWGKVTYNHIHAAVTGNSGDKTSTEGGSQGHRHRVNFNSSSTGNHNHTVSGNTSTTGNHTHKVNVLPPYYALAFIMKL